MYKAEKNLNRLVKVNPELAKLVDGHNLTTDEAERLAYEIYASDTVGLHSATFVGAIHAKGETAEELYGILRAIKRLAVNLNLNFTSDKIIDLSGTGAGIFKSINVSTAASFVVAAAGYLVPKQTYFGITGTTGSADVLGAQGADVSKISKDEIGDILKEVGMCPFHYVFISPKLANRVKISKLYFGERKIKVRSPMHLITNAFNPIKMDTRVYGCYSEKYVETIANLFMKLGFKKTLTFYARIGMPEISNVGDTLVVEQNGNWLRKYVVKPADLGVTERKSAEIKTGGKEQNIIDFLRVLLGKDSGAKSDLVVVNAAAALYALGESKSIAESVPKVQKLIGSGEGFKVLEKLVKLKGNHKLLKYWLSRI